MESSNTKKGAKPVQTFRLRGISASVLEDGWDDGESVFHKVSLQRTYRQNGEWRTTQSLSRDDLPIAWLLMQKAWEFILQAEAKDTADEEAD